MIPQVYTDSDIDGISVVSATALVEDKTLVVYFSGAWYAQLDTGVPVNLTETGVYLVESADCQMVELSVNFDALIGGETTIRAFNPQKEDFPIVGTGKTTLSSLVFEDIARKMYGNPNLGILLRQLNILDEGMGADYILPVLEELSKEEVAPESHIFQSLEALEHVFEEKLW